MKILFCSSEVYPYSKTGGLADMAFFLPKGLSKIGHHVTVITPYYQGMTKYHSEMTYLSTAIIRFGGIETTVHYFEIIKDDIRYLFIQNMHYFERNMLYGYNDDAERFSCFSYAILEAIKTLNLDIDILHINDWQTGMIPYLLDTHYRHQGERYFKLHTLLTIHNLEYQGIFDPYVSRFFNHDFDYTYIHFDRVNFLKAGIMRATLINTVSPTYRQEVLTSEYGFTLDGALLQREKDFYGILNGIETSVFDPKTDPFIFKNYVLSQTTSGKKANKKALLTFLNFEVDTQKPIVSYIGRLATQKGIHLLQEILEEVIQYSNAYYVIIGTGESAYEDFFKYLHKKYPNRLYYYQAFDEKFAHQVYAASDLFLMPSRFEPCGLGQMIAMIYGTLPIVRETGGLKDTVIPYNQYTKEGTGFSFKNYDSYDLKERIFEALSLYENQKPTFRLLVNQAMKQDFTNEKMVASYNKLYEKMMGV